MKKQVHLKNKKVDYTLKKSKRAKRLRIAVYCDASVVVTAPYRLRENIIEEFILSKSKWLLEKLDFFKKMEKKLHFKFSKKDYVKNQEQAKGFVLGRLEYYNKIYKFKYNNVYIKNQKTVWGSCSKKRNLNFNYKILFLPSNLADYIIVHELCHLKEMNHSNKFWNLVSKTYPNFKEIRKELKNHGLRL